MSDVDRSGPGQGDNVVDLSSRRARGREAETWQPPLPFAISPGAHDGAVMFRVQGELDLASSPALEGALADALGGRDGLREVRFDLAQVTFLDVAGVRALCRCAEMAERHGAPMRVEGAQPNAVRVLELCGKLELLGPQDED